MFRFLLPKETDFFDYFEQHCRLTICACEELAALTEPGASIAERAARIAELERETDAVTHRCIKALQKTFITPFDRSHIHELIKGLDDIVDSIDDASSRLLLYGITELRAEVKPLADVLVCCARALGKAVGLLRNLKNKQEIKKICITVHGLENDADYVMRAAIKRLFEESSDPITIIKWKEIFENLEAATDRCEDVADVIQAIMIEAS